MRQGLNIIYYPKDSTEEALVPMGALVLKSGETELKRKTASGIESVATTSTVSSALASIVINDWQASTAVALSEVRRATASVGTIELGDLIRSNSTRTTRSTFDATEAGNWTEFSPDLVTSVAGKTGAVTLVASDAGAEPANSNIQSHVISAHAPANAEQNISPDWNAVSGDGQILNKPTIPTVNNTLTSTSTTEALSAAQGKVLQDGKYPIIVVGTIDANSTALQDNTIYVGNNTGAATNTPGGWAWSLFNFRMGTWRHQIFQTASNPMYYRSINGTFTTNVWTKIAELTTDWTSYTPVITSESGAWSSYTATGRYRIVSKMLTVSFRVIFTGNSSAADALYVSLPSGLTMDSTVMTGGAGWDTDQVGFAILGDSGTISGVPAIITTRTNQKILVKYYNAAAASYLTCPGLNNTAPWTWAINDTVDGQFVVPIL